MALSLKVLQNAGHALHHVPLLYSSCMSLQSASGWELRAAVACRHLDLDIGLDLSKHWGREVEVAVSCTTTADAT